MSMWFWEGEKIMGFTDYLLSESIVPVSTNNYGTNIELNDQDWIKWNNNKITFMYHNDIYYMIGISSEGEVMFTVSSEMDISKRHDLLYLSKIFNTDRVQTRNVLILFGLVIYILIQGAIKFHHKEIKFSAADPSLGTAYNNIVKNKQLLQKVEGYGYKYDGFDGSDYRFVRI